MVRVATGEVPSEDSFPGSRHAFSMCPHMWGESERDRENAQALRCLFLQRH